MERLQSRAARIVLKTVHLSTQDMVSGLGWDPLKTRREKHIVKLAKNNYCLGGQAPSYFSDYFRRRTMIFMTMTLGVRLSRLSIDKVNLKLTKRAFFYKGATLFNDCM